MKNTIKPQTQSSSDAKPNQFELWKAYEDVAMHFNDLIIKLRVQALAALATFSSIILILRESEIIDLPTLLIIMIFLCAGWISIWVLDMGYYNRLLEGSVQALLKIEKVKFDEFDENVENIILSTSIEKAFSQKKLKHETLSWYKDVRHWFYIIFLLAIIIITISVGYQLTSEICVN